MAKPSAASITEIPLKDILTLHLARLHGKGIFRHEHFENSNIQNILNLFSKKFLQRLNVDEVIEDCKNNNIHMIAINQPGYPELLKEIDNPPLILFCSKPKLNFSKSITIVGTREPSPAASFYAEELAAQLAKSQVTVISGLARGIDQSVHRGALRMGSTAAVVAQGLLIPFAKSTFEYVNHSQMTLITEYPPRTTTRRFFFPMRNRILAGLTSVTVFIEGEVKSGAMITANYAADYSRTVFAALHTAFQKPNGAKHLLRDGAHNISRFFPLKSSTRNELNIPIPQLILEKKWRYLGSGKWYRLINRNQENLLKLLH